MNVLIDTHVLLWWLANDKKLSVKARKIIENPENVIFVSSVSAWEISIKKSLGKLKSPDNLEEVLEENQFFALNISIKHALAAGKLRKIHEDPFDRMLIAQAGIDDLPVMTHDKIFKKYEVSLILI